MIQDWKLTVTMKDYGSGKGDAKIMDELAAKLFARFSAPLYWFNGVKPAEFIHDGNGAITSTVFETEIQNDLAEWWKDAFPADRDFEVVMSEENGSDEMHWQLTHGECTWGRFEISDGILNSYNGLESFVTIPGSVTEIGVSAFAGCTSLVSVTIPEGVTEIGVVAFAGCTSLVSVTIPDGVTKIGVAAFSGCRSLTSVTIPEGVTIIDLHAFSGCRSLTSVTIPEGVTEIGESAFTGCRSLISVTIPESVTEIGGAAFAECRSLTSVTISEGVTEIGGAAFAGCRSLTSVTIPSSVTYIGEAAFFKCMSLSSVIISASVTKISLRAFYGCTSLSSVTIPSSVTYIGKAAFFKCRSLSSVTIPENVTEIGLNAFQMCPSLGEIHYAGTKGQWTFALAGFNRIPKKTTVYCADGDAECIKDKTKIVIPDGVTEIGLLAFDGCTSLTSVTIPASVTKIGLNAFKDCTSLGEIHYAGTKDRWTFAPAGFNCIPDKTTVYCSDGEAERIKDKRKIVIPDGITEIGVSAFEGYTSLTSVTIPASVTKIGKFAFRDCTSLDEINFGGTEDDWNSISKERDWNYEVPTTDVHCRDGDVDIYINNDEDEED